MGIYPLFDLEKVLLLTYLRSKLGQEVEIWYVHLVGVLDVLFGGVDFSAPFHPLIASKKWVFAQVFLFFEFVPRITRLQIEPGN